jgi:hypothetical protein
VLRLTLLSPSIIEAILAGQQPDHLQLADLLKPFPTSWTEQQALLRDRRNVVAGICTISR